MFITTYWISQIIVVIAYALLGIGFRKEKRLQILTFSTIYQVLMIIHYLFQEIKDKKCEFNKIYFLYNKFLKNCAKMYISTKNAIFFIAINTPVW